MGTARWSPHDWTDYRSAASTKTSRDALFASRGLHRDLDPRHIRVRESVDSDLNPQSTAIIVALDVTGSMGMIPEALVREGLGTLVEQVLDRKPVTDPHMMFMGVGDAHCDRAPLQATQFEADIRIAQQLQMLYLEGGGGGNNFESYNLPWYFAAMKTKIDCFTKRQKKGYLFTVGDELPPPGLQRAHVKHIFGDNIEADLPSHKLLGLVEQMYHVFHVVVEEGSYCRGNRRGVYDQWRDLLGQHVIPLSDYHRLPEVVVSAIQVAEGANREEVASSWDGGTSVVVANAMKALELKRRSTGLGGLLRFS